MGGLRSLICAGATPTCEQSLFVNAKYTEMRGHHQNPTASDRKKALTYIE